MAVALVGVKPSPLVVIGTLTRNSCIIKRTMSKVLLAEVTNGWTFETPLVVATNDE